ncbi:hypothetical protein [Bacillus sp. S/N-304-OC-R1]|uniref:hypothetical protein n=1 Tax=Bacillus sp. S/N-304-OC-R1 TaxID=2758034 RepID=UPI001C8D7B92|nr:hypothetical protein [Bacillus sp. S/N-304-OC-R1]MBY0121723.1 hypothetical protein [Bacillus sp. S/N-304-OC-R1]
MSRSRVKKKNSSFRGSVVTLIIILIVVGIVNGCNLIRNHIVSNSNFNNKFNEEDFNRKLIPRDTLIDALKIEYPRIDLVKSTDYGYSNPSNVEEYEIVTGINENGSTVSTGIQIWTYSKEDN